MRSIFPSALAALLLAGCHGGRASDLPIAHRGLERAAYQRFYALETRASGSTPADEQPIAAAPPATPAPIEPPLEQRTPPLELTASPPESLEIPQEFTPEAAAPAAPQAPAEPAPAPPPAVASAPAPEPAPAQAPAAVPGVAGNDAYASGRSSFVPSSSDAYRSGQTSFLAPASDAYPNPGAALPEAPQAPAAAPPVVLMVPFPVAIDASILGALAATPATTPANNSAGSPFGSPYATVHPPVLANRGFFSGMPITGRAR